MSHRGPRSFFLTLALYLGLMALFLSLPGCATRPVAAQDPVLVPVSCEAARMSLIPPEQFLQLDASQPGEAAKAYALNRREWIFYAQTLALRLESCK